MVIRLVAGVVFTVAWSIFCAFLADYELKKVIKKESESEVKDKRFTKKPKIIYGCTITVLNILLVVALSLIYKDTTIVEHLKRIGLIGIIEVAAVTDRKYNIIPNDLIKLGILMRAVFLVAEICIFRSAVLSIVMSDLIGILAVVIIVVLCLIFMRGSVGMGDLKLMMLMALCQGIDGFTTSGMLSLVAAFFVAIYYLISRKKSRKDSMAFAPFLAVGTYLGIFLTGL